MLSNIRILITGANSGMGISICEKLLKNNAKLVIFYNKNRSEIDNLLEKNADKKTSIEIFQVNLLDENEIKKALKTTLEKGSVDGFVHSVTLPITNKSILEKHWNDFQSHLELQTKSFLQIVQSLIPSMKEKNKGKIVSVLTAYTVGKPPSNISDYLVGKYSLLALSKSLAVELGQFGINVNCVSPSMTKTPLIEKLPSKLKEITAMQVPMGRLAEPEDVSSTVLFLCSKNSDYISGENLLISGGNTMY